MKKILSILFLLSTFLLKSQCTSVYTSTCPAFNDRDNKYLYGAIKSNSATSISNTVVVNQQKFDSLLYYTKLSSFGSNNILGGYFFASTLSAVSNTALIQLGSTIPAGYRLCITDFNFSPTTIPTGTVTLFINSGNVTNVKYCLSLVKGSTSGMQYDIQRNFDPRVPVILDPEQSLYISITSLATATTYNLTIRGYISKI
jgi:hypothetical protein